MAVTAGTRLGPYEIVNAIGSGGMGDVYKARDTRLGRDVAIKVLPAAFAQDTDRRGRFEREAQTVAALSHPNIISIFDTGEIRTGDGPASFYIVMELLDGQTLRERLADGALPVRKTVEIATQIARGLGAAHDKGLIHRDLKPENIFVLRDGQVKILDFGLARQAATGAGAAETVAAMTDPGMVMGTVGYMAPEQIRSQMVDARADLFALGVVLYEMLSGRRAFQRDTAAETMTAILKEDPPDLLATQAEIPPAFDRIVRHCLEKQPVERFQSARDVAFALEALSGSSPAGVTGAHAAASAAPARRSRWWLLPASIATTAIVVAAVDRAIVPKAPAPVRFSMKTFEPQSVVNARFMPDGQTIVFSSALTGNVPQLFEIRTGTLEARPFGPPRTHLLSVSSKGELAVLTNTAYINQRLYHGTLARMSIEGSPRPWLENIREADWSPDGTALAVVHDMGSRDRLEFPIGKVLYETGGYVSDPRVSPDGTRVAFLDHQARYDDRGWVKVVDTAGAVTTLAGEFWGEEGLAWSRDGSTVYFGADNRQVVDEARTGDLSYQVMEVAIARPGTAAHALTSPGDFTIHDVGPDGRWLATRDDSHLGVSVRLAGDQVDRNLSWLNKNWGACLSRDGSRLLFSDGNAGGNYGVVWRKTDGSPVVRLGEGSTLAFSPDDAWALAVIFTPPQLVIYPLGAGEAIRPPRGAIDQYQNAFWFPDGKSLLFVGNEQAKPARTYRQTIPDGLPTPILPDGVLPALVSPDGSLVLGRDAAGKWQWYPVSGAAPRPAAGLTADDTLRGVVGLSADGVSVFVQASSDVPAKIEIVNTTTGRRAPFKEIGPADRAGTFFVRVASLSSDGRQYAYDYLKRLSTLFVVSTTK